MAAARLRKDANGSAKNDSNGALQHQQLFNRKTDYSRWRLRDDRGRQTWHYLTTDEELKDWPQTTADKYHLGLPIVL